MRKTWLVLGLAALCGCNGSTTLPDEPASAYIKVVNPRGRLIRPDRVWWYYTEESGRFDGAHEATCINDGCSVWSVPVEVTGDVFVSASLRRPFPNDPMCWYLGYDSRTTVASADDPPLVTLRLDTRTMACA